MRKLLVAALLLLTNIAIAQKPADSTHSANTITAPAQPKMPTLQKGVYVTDFTGTLTNDQVTSLNNRAAEIRQKTGFELIIVLMDALPKGMNVNDATTAIDEQWNPGDIPDVNRLIYIAGLRQHGHRIKAVRGIKSGVIFNQARCTAILSAMKSDYDKHDYNAGLQLMVDDISTVLKINTSQSGLNNSTNIYIGAFILAIILVLYAFFKNKKKQQMAH